MVLGSAIAAISLALLILGFNIPVLGSYAMLASVIGLLLLASIGLGLVVAVLGYLSTTGWARTTALRTAERLEEPEVRDFEPRPPGGADQQVVRGGDKVGRNDPCPCGSGKKYKKCCGA